MVLTSCRIFMLSGLVIDFRGKAHAFSCPDPATDTKTNDNIKKKYFMPQLTIC
jgi:hypothetical protein